MEAVLLQHCLAGVSSGTVAQRQSALLFLALNRFPLPAQSVAHLHLPGFVHCLRPLCVPLCSAGSCGTEAPDSLLATGGV